MWYFTAYFTFPTCSRNYYCSFRYFEHDIYFYIWDKISRYARYVDYILKLFWWVRIYVGITSIFRRCDGKLSLLIYNYLSFPDAISVIFSIYLSFLNYLSYSLAMTFHTTYFGNLLEFEINLIAHLEIVIGANIHSQLRGTSAYLLLSRYKKKIWYLCIYNVQYKNTLVKIPIA